MTSTCSNPSTRHWPKASTYGHMTIAQTLAIHNFVFLLWPSDSASKQRLPTANRKAASAALTSSSSATSACDADAQAPCRQGILEIVAMVTANITGNDTILPARSFNKHSLLLRIAELINAMGNPWKTMASYPKRRRGLATWLKTMIICFGNIVIAISAGGRAVNSTDGRALYTWCLTRAVRYVFCLF